MRGIKGGIMMRDEIEVIGKGSVIQHGKHNDRIYLMKLNKQDSALVIEELSRLANKNSYSKIFCKIPKNMAPSFIADGYILEAYIPRFYNMRDDLFFVSKFLDSDRLLDIEKTKLSSLKQLLIDKPRGKKDLEHTTSAYSVRKLVKSDAYQAADIYREVFESYPFPIHNPGYIQKTMDENIEYYGAEKNGKLAALASSEVDFEGKNAEMTDFATRVKHHGKNLSVLLLKEMENEMKKQGIITLFTIARLNSIPMNKTFLRSDYRYSGTLIKNTNIAGNIESMNVYYKHI